MKKLLHSNIITFIRRYRLFSFSVVAALVAFGLMIAGQDTAQNWVLSLTVLIVALPIVKNMYHDVQNGTYGIDILAITAIVSSVLLKEYWTAMVIVLMLTGGEALEDYAENRSKRELDALLSRAPSMAHVIRGRKIVDIPVSEVQVGDRIIIKPGEVVPVDAAILEGNANFDESSLTGESLPQTKEPGEQVLSGSVNLDGAVTAKALHSAADSQYQQIIKLVKNASNSQAPFVKLADRYAIPFTVVAFAIAGTVWFISGDPIRFLQVIVVATPCPLLLAAPIAIISGMSRASKQGIIVRTGSALEKLAKVQTVAFDKTGTLTRGKLKVSDVKTYGYYSKNDILGFASALETSSHHVLASAINEAALEARAKVPKAKNVTETPGHGLSAGVSGKHILVGRMALLKQHQVTIPAKFKASDISQTSTFVAINGELAGVISFTDEIRPETQATLDQLRGLGIKHIQMITGDNRVVAASVAKQLGITEVVSEALPGDKLRAVEALPNHPVAFVGDGVNDAPVLMASDVGIALGARGSTAASESADMVIMLDDLGRVASGVEIAKRTFKIARQSILIGIGLSVILMFIFATGKFPPIYGAAIQELVDVVVIINALRAHSAGRRI